MGKIDVISGVQITPLKIMKHSMGDVYHGMKESDIGFEGFQEVYFSTIKFKHIKSWKKHLKMTLNLIVPIGAIRFVMFDDRDDSNTKGTFMDVNLSLDNYHRLTLPPNIWLAFQGLGPSTNLLMNIANLEHDIREVVREDIEKIKYNW
jgi:dTDP-4-dehydrorhamnose 3,5-epimerase